MFGGTELLVVWEDGQELSSLERSMLAVRTWETVGDETTVSIDDLNRQVLRLRSLLFGKDIEFYATCDECGEPLEFTVDASQFASEEATVSEDPLLIGGVEVECHPPTAADLVAAAGMPDPPRWVAERCVRAKDDAVEQIPNLTHEDVGLIEDWLREQHPLLEVIFAIACPGCGHEWDQLLDIDGLLWRDIDSEARRLLEDVDRLARSYGWNEADILAMSPQRRARYLELSE